MSNNNPPLYEDLDDWSSGDPFTDSKESDVFAPFEGDVERAMIAASLSGEYSPVARESIPNHRVVVPTPSQSTDGGCNKISRKRGSSASVSTLASSGTSTKGDIIPTRRKKKPKGMPKRPLSAYNLYFQAERATILAKQEIGGGPRIGFEGLGKIIGKQWRDLSSEDRKMYEKMAEKDSERYRKEMEAYNDMKTKKIHEEEEREAQTPTLLRLPTRHVGSPANEFGARSVPSYGNSFLKIQGTNMSTDEQFRHRNAQSPSPMLLSMPPHPTAQQLHGSAPSYLSGDQQTFPPPATSYVVPEYAGVSAPSSGTEHRQSPPVGVQYVHVQRPPSPPYSHPPPLKGGGGGPEGPYVNSDLSGGNSSSSFPMPPRMDSFPLPPGMEIILSDRNGVDRKYRVQYSCYTMTREAAQKYIESVTGASGPCCDIQDREQEGVSNAVSAPSHIHQACHPHSEPPSPSSNQHYGGGWMM